MLQGRVIRQAASYASPTVEAIDAERLIGKRVDEVRVRGKHLFLSFDEGWVVHSHLGMSGSWHAYPFDAAWAYPTREASLALRTDAADVVNFRAKHLSLTSSTRLRRDDYLKKLGPDLMLADTDFEGVLPRLRVHDESPIGEAVMNQTIACGIGNIYKSETLFVTRTNPWARVGELSDESLRHVLSEARRLLRLNRGKGARTIRLRNDGPRFWVYGRAGEPCLACGGKIFLRRQGEAGRTTYWCPTCQR